MLNTIQDDMKRSLKAGEKMRLSTLRMLLAALKNESIEKRHELSEEEIFTVVQREIKLRRHASEEFKKGFRDDLVQEAEQEIIILESYLPRQLSDAELQALAQQVVTELKATPRDFGKAMREIMLLIKGRADGKRVQDMLRQVLG
ncbi:MAG: GatB/YqeY domain-containing protein [Dethiobacter sp.]|nr:GatB/YqeY domain-containing protein [Dethiobacter sp.]MBS3948054.1 GatB/YqeY domain-containing protein [Dethiobacter sp.]